MTKQFITIAITAFVFLFLGVLAGMFISSKQSYRYQTIKSPVGSGRGLGHLTGFFKEDAQWRGGVTSTDARGEPEWHTFYNLEGEKEGPHINYHPEGNLSGITHYRDGRRHGQFIVFTPSGNMDQMGFYKDDELVEGSQFFGVDQWKGKNEYWENVAKKNQEFQAASNKRFIESLPEETILKKSLSK